MYLELIRSLANIYLFKVNNRNFRKRCYICLKLNTPERHQWRRSCVFIVNFKHILHHFLVFILLTLSKYLFARMLLILANVFSDTYRCSSLVFKVLHGRLKVSFMMPGLLTHSFPMHPFSTPWKHQKTIRFSDVFKG